MSSQLILASAPQQGVRFVGAANSFFTGIVLPEQIGNITAQTGARPLRDLYTNTAEMSWQETVTPQIIQAANTAGQFVLILDQNVTPYVELDAGYECRRAGNLITSDGKLQLAISENNGYPAPADARWCIYYPSEDFNQEVIAIEYTSTDVSDPNSGNNITKLLELTGRMKNFVGNNGPVCNGTLNNDLLNDETSIFAKGCLVTWETPSFSGEAVMVAVAP